MQGSAMQTFTYTRQRQDCYRFVGTFSTVLLFEAGVWMVLILFLGPQPEPVAAEIDPKAYHELMEQPGFIAFRLRKREGL